jgi:hypothetical protein
MKSLMPILAAALIFAGCEKIEGQLNVTNPVKLITSRNVNRTIAVGTYSADIKANTSKKITLRLNNDSDEKYIFTLPDGAKIPDNGSFAFGEVGQPVDINGTVSTAVTKGPVRQSTEQCQYTEQVQVCTPNPKGGVICSIQQRTVWGHKWIEYYDRQTDKNFTLSILNDHSTENEAAQFVGDSSWAERIVLRETQCR